MKEKRKRIKETFSSDEYDDLSEFESLNEDNESFVIDEESDMSEMNDEDLLSTLTAITLQKARKYVKALLSMNQEDYD